MSKECLFLYPQRPAIFEHYVWPVIVWPTLNVLYLIPSNRAKLFLSSHAPVFWKPCSLRISSIFERSRTWYAPFPLSCDLSTSVSTDASCFDIPFADNVVTAIFFVFISAACIAVKNTHACQARKDGFHGHSWCCRERWLWWVLKVCNNICNRQGVRHEFYLSFGVPSFIWLSRTTGEKLNAWINHETHGIHESKYEGLV